jgi:CHASE2 domain-containing sensor protein
LIERLANANAAAIVFDIHMDEPSEYDQELVDAVRAAQHKGTAIIIGAAEEISENPAFRNVFAGIGLLCIGRPRELSYATLVPLAVKRGEEYLASIALLSDLRGGKIGTIDFERKQLLASDSQGRVRGIDFSRYEELSSAQRCKSLRKGDTVAQTIVRFSPLDALRDPSRRVRYESFFDGSTISLEQFANKKIIVVGSEVGEDPVSVRYRFRNEDRFGFEVHADVLGMLLQRITFRPLDRWEQFQIMVGMAILGQMPMLLKLFARVSFRRFYCLVILMLYMVVSVAVAVKYQILLNALYQVGAFLLTFGASTRIARRLQLW